MIHIKCIVILMWFFFLNLVAQSLSLRSSSVLVLGNLDLSEASLLGSDLEFSLQGVSGGLSGNSQSFVQGDTCLFVGRHDDGFK